MTEGDPSPVTVKSTVHCCPVIGWYVALIAAPAAWSGAMNAAVPSSVASRLRFKVVSWSCRTAAPCRTAREGSGDLPMQPRCARFRFVGLLTNRQAQVGPFTPKLPHGARAKCLQSGTFRSPIEGVAGGDARLE